MCLGEDGQKGYLYSGALAGGEPGADSVGATEARERTAAVGFTPATAGGDAYPGGEPPALAG